MPRTQRQEARPAALNFITFGEPAESTSTRAIRSHAAKAGWKQRKKRFVAPPPVVVGEHTPKSAHRNPTVVPKPARTDSVAHRNTPSLSSSTSSSSISTASSCPTPLPSSLSSPPLDTKVDTAISNTDFTRTQPADDLELLPQTQDLVAHRSCDDDQWNSPNLFYQPVGTGYDPFSQFPVPWQKPFGSLIHFYRKCLGEVWLKVISADWGEQGNNDFRDFPLKMAVSQSEPAIFFAIMSNSSVMAPPSNAISMRQQPYLSQWLRHKAVEALRDAIADPERAYTDSVICTVDFVYVNEALRGEIEIAQKIHGPALQRMVAKRGGLHVIAADGKDGLILSRMLTWGDRIVASTLNIPMLFPNYTEDPSLSQTQWTGIWRRVQTLM